jgi:FkbH-like protein
MTAVALRELAVLEQDVDRYIEAGQWGQAQVRLRELWRRCPGPLLARFVTSRFERLRPHVPVVTTRVALLGSFTVDPLAPVLKAAAAVAGIHTDIYISPYSTYAQAMLDPQSELHTFEPSIVLLAVQTRDIASELWSRYAHLAPDEGEAVVERVLSSFGTWIASFRSHSPAAIVVHSLEHPERPACGVLDLQSARSQYEALARLNLELRSLCRGNQGVYLLDYGGLVARRGWEAWHDEAMWWVARFPIAADCVSVLVDEWLRFIHPLTGRVCKALVCDLDDTLWGGTIGEDGLHGIQVGPEPPGVAYLELQRAILDIQRRGVLLAVCSRNNHEEALAALAEHPHMLLRPEHFAALRINWRDKAENLREIARELNLSVEALALLDDNPIERDLVRTQLPEVTVVDLPDAASGYASALRACPEFERLTLVAEDAERGRMYADERRRAELRQQVSSLEEFYHSLQMRATLSRADPPSTARVAQLTQRTNQFNLTTKRYSEQEVARLAEDPAWGVYCLRLEDRYGDSGIVGVALTREVGQAWEIDTLLLSCRVIGRTVESAFLAGLARLARDRGAMLLRGWFIPSYRNSPASDFFANHGFAQVAPEEQHSCWQLDLSVSAPEPPPWIALCLDDAR